MILESKIERQSCKAALELGVISKKLNADGERGWPDRMFMIPGGRPLFVEFKSPSGVLSAGQAIIIRRLFHYGYDVHVCNSVGQFITLIKGVLNGSGA